MSERCAKCGRSEEGAVPLYRCDGCSRIVCREHYLLEQQRVAERLSAAGVSQRYEGATGCALCAPEAFARVRRADDKRRVSLAAAVGLVACAAAAYLIVARGWPRLLLAGVALFAVGALLGLSKRA
jgi:hypothetical protein